MSRLTFAVLAGAPLLLAAPAFAAASADLAGELGAAQSYAGLALAAKDINTARAHMHQAINCLVGPSGDGFDLKQTTVCGESSGGAIADERDQVKKARLSIAKRQLETGIAAETLGAAQVSAASAQATLLSVRGSEL